MLVQTIYFCFVFVFLPMASSIQLMASELKTFSSSGIREIKIQNGSGNVIVKKGQTKSIQVKSRNIEFSQIYCQKSIRANEGELVIDVRGKRKKLLAQRCRVNFEVSVPRGISIEAKIGSGDFSTTDFEGEIEVEIGSGDAEVKGKISDLELSVGSGSVSVETLSGEAEIKVGSGDVRLALVKSYSAEETGKESGPQLDIQTGSGDVHLDFPNQLKFRTDVRSGSGRFKNMLGEDDNSKLLVRVRTGSGDVKIK